MATKEQTKDDLAITNETTKNGTPHSAPFLSLLYSTASNLLSHVVELEPEKEEEKEASPDANQPIDIPNKKGENFLSFIYDLAGISSSPVGSPVASPIVHTPPEAVPNIKEPKSKKLVLFDDAELEEFDFPEALHEDYSHQNVYIPTHQEVIEYEKPSFSLDILKKLHHHLPPLLQEASNVTLLYSLENHGISIHTLYHNTADKGPCLLVIKDTNDQLFGAFSSEELHIQPGYYGNGTTFLWKMDGDGISVYRATGKNDYYVLSEAHCIAFGGGHGKFGLWIDDELNNGHSERCETFGNETLSSATEYTIATFEIWGFII
ncbi:hypothetical protein HDV01_005932 [Terramyces sp. JEL0728]|nr:hypothetical protein HDV01_005932 [Terramyces sp. JEL0728]